MSVLLAERYLVRSVVHKITSLHLHGMPTWSQRYHSYGKVVDTAAHIFVHLGVWLHKCETRLICHSDIFINVKKITDKECHSFKGKYSVHQFEMVKLDL